MKSLYSKLSSKTFKTISIIFMILGDLVICRWLWVKFMHNPKLELMIRYQAKVLLRNPSFQGQTLPDDFHLQIMELLQKSLIVMFIMVIGFHLLNYLSYWLDKVLAFYYLRFMAWTAAVGSILAGYASMDLGVLGGLLILIGFFYFFVAFGFIYFPVKRKTEQET